VDEKEQPYHALQVPAAVLAQFVQVDIKIFG